MKKNIILSSLLLVLFACPIYATSQKVSLNSGPNGLVWMLTPQRTVPDAQALFQPSYNTAQWVPAVVPGAVYTSYVEAGLEPDPNYGDNAYKADKSKFDVDFWYRTQFETAKMPQGKRQWLCFEGINRKAQIYLNGVKIGSLDGFMDRGKFDVTELLSKDGRPNVLAVLVIAPTNPIANCASPTYISSAGWDWMPYVPGLLNGITDDVYATASGDITIEDPWIRTKVPTLDKALVSLSTELSNHSQETCEGTLKGIINPGQITFEKKFKLPAGKQRVFKMEPRELTQLVLDNPQLWWPHGYGNQPLYHCQLAVEVNGQTSDVQDITFGIKEYDYTFVDGVFQLKINGEPIYCKGGNWGMSEYMLRCRGEEYDLKIKLHKMMNFNMIRNWIGSTTDDEFYQACDKYGVMVFDDFWLNSHPNLPDDVFAFNHNAVEKIKRLRNHPCIAIWCGDNEGVPQPPLNEWLREDVKTYDGGDRWYQPISREYGFSGSGPWTNSHPIWYFTAYPSGFGTHKQDGWGFRSEIGTAVFTNYESYQKFMPNPEQWPPQQEMLEKHFFGRSSFNSRPTRYLASVAYNYGEATGTEDFCIKAQLLNYETNKAMFEGWQHNLWHDATGLLIWMSQSAYPSLVWQTYDYYYDLNGAFWGASKACEPIHVQWSYADNTVKVVNTTNQAFNDVRVEARVYNLDGSEVTRYAQTATGNSLPNKATKFLTIPFPQDQNLARGKKATCSSDGVTDYHSAQAITDGNTGSAWSAQRGENQWACLDLGSPVTFSKLVLTWESFASACYQILVSQNGTEWTPVYTAEKGSDDIQEISIKPVTARYVKIANKTESVRNMALYEVEIYAPEQPQLDLTPTHFIRLRLTQSDGTLLSENFYWRATQLGDYKALNDLAPAQLQVKNTTTEKDGKTYIRATVTNRGKGIAFAIRMIPVYKKTGAQILPALSDDNYFSLLGGEKKTVTWEIDSSLLQGEPYEIQARPYNR